MMGLAGMTGLYTWQLEPFWLEFVHRKMHLPQLPDHLIGKTLMQISDVHVGNRFDYGYIIESFKRAQQYEPDFVAYTGDYVNYESEEQLSQLKEVLSYAVKGRMGTVGILGNHDYGSNWKHWDIADNITGLLSDAGIEVLRNQQKPIGGINFIGFDDYWAVNFRPELVMNSYDKSGCNLVLCHNPDVCDLDVWNGYTGWILSGHTHGD